MSKATRSKASAASSEPRVAGVRITNPQRVVYPDLGLTKLDVANYYAAVAPLLLAHIRNRPLSIIRCPQGEGHACFYQRHPMESLPEAVQRVSVQGRDEIEEYMFVRDIEGLITLVQRGAMEFHPWTCRAPALERADRIVFDLDPAPDVAWKVVREAAIELRDLLADLKLKGFPQTTGGKGLHVFVPTERRFTWEQVSQFAQLVARSLAAAKPKRYVAVASKAARTGRIFVDYLRNQQGATHVAPYSLRARPGAPVATPITWAELESVESSQQFHLSDVVARIGAKRWKDPWSEMARLKQRLPREAKAAGSP